MRRSNPLPSTLPSSPFCSTLNTSYIAASDMCEVCTEAVHSTLNTGYITGFAVCSYLTHLWCSYLSPKTGISVFLFDAFVVFLFEPGPIYRLLLPHQDRLPRVVQIHQRREKVSTSYICFCLLGFLLNKTVR